MIGNIVTVAIKMNSAEKEKGKINLQVNSEKDLLSSAQYKLELNGGIGLILKG